MMKTLKDLAVALINATLILVALCLFLAWKVADKADHIAATFAQNLIEIEPLKENLEDVSTELAALRADLAVISSQSSELKSASMQRLQADVAQLSTRLDGARQSLIKLREAPTQLIDYAIESTADRITQGINDIRSCSPPPQS